MKSKKTLSDDSGISSGCTWIQRHINLHARPKGCHLITNEILQKVPEINQIGVGLCNVFIQHTSASLTINENCDPDVRKDMDMMLDQLAPVDAPYVHTDEGEDDMPGHVKSSIMGCSLTIPISQGKLALGTWQGIWLNEHRYSAGSRRIMITIQGSPA